MEIKALAENLGVDITVHQLNSLPIEHRAVDG